MKRISRRDVLKTGGLATAAFVSANGNGAASHADDQTIHREDNVIIKSINSDPAKMPSLYGRLFNRNIAFISSVFPNVPGLRLDACTFEPAIGFLKTNLLGMAIPDDNQIVLSHRVKDFPWLVHVTTLTAQPDGIEAVGRLAVDRKARVGEVQPPENLAAPNLCWCFQKSPNFVAGNVAAPPYGEQQGTYQNWIGRCFIFTEQGRMFLDRTDRTRTDEYPTSDPRNNPVWSQNYVGVWQRIGGEPLPANTSRTRYTVPVIGAVSNDTKYQVAVVSESPRYVAQGWHTCLHHVVNWMPTNVPVLERQWRMKLYAMTNDPILLMTRVANDFPTALKLKDHAVALQ